MILNSVIPLLGIHPTVRIAHVANEHVLDICKSICIIIL
jgi:hypothetical protein